MLDFGSIGGPPTGKRPTHPIEIFEKLPNLPGTPNDLWRGQTEALNGWYGAGKASDVLIALNTGAGKTLVGLLIAQSLVNQHVENVIYLCATIDLVLQTEAEARKIGLECTTRIDRDFSNDLFESGRGFCVTTYHALFNGHSSIRKKHFPGAVIFDDAHVAEKMMRDAFTLRVSGRENPDLYKEICTLFEPHFAAMDRRAAFRDAVDNAVPSILLAAPSAVFEVRQQLFELLRLKAAPDKKLTYAFEHLKDKLDRCAILFGGAAVEITPPFLPSLALDIFERPTVRRVYLSATLNYKSDIARAFGRIPDPMIEPRNDAGNGERLILFS